MARIANLDPQAKAHAGELCEGNETGFHLGQRSIMIGTSRSEREGRSSFHTTSASPRPFREPRQFVHNDERVRLIARKTLLHIVQKVTGLCPLRGMPT